MDDLIKQGVAAFKAGDINFAKELFTKAVKQFPNDERAWGWMYNVSQNDRDRVQCLEQILRINPTNDKAHELLEELMEYEPNLISPATAKSKQSAIHENKARIQHSPTDDKPNKILLLILVIIAAVLLFSIFGILVVNTLNTASTKSPVISLTSTFQSQSTPRATQKLKPKINPAALTALLDNMDMFPSGYVLSERINDINTTLHEAYFKNNLIGYSEVTADAPGLTEVVTYLFLYKTSEAADAAYTVELNRKTTADEFALKGLYGNERFGRVWFDSRAFYVYTYRDGRLLVMYYFLDDTYVDYSFMEEIVKKIDSRIQEYSQ